MMGYINTNETKLRSSFNMGEVYWDLMRRLREERRAEK